MSNIVKNNEGFTIIELLAVLTILIIIMAIAMPSIISLLGRTNENVQNEKITLLKGAAQKYVHDNYNDIKSSCYIDVSILAINGYITAENGNYLIDSDGNQIDGFISYNDNGTIDNMADDIYEYTNVKEGETCLTP